MRPLKRRALAPKTAIALLTGSLAVVPVAASTPVKQTGPTGRIVFTQFTPPCPPRAQGFACRETVAVMNADGSGRRFLTRNKYDVSPTWSPDGKQIAFLRETGRRLGCEFDIYVMRSDGTKQRNVGSMGICGGTRQGGRLSWTSDGGALIYAEAEGRRNPREVNCTCVIGLDLRQGAKPRILLRLNGNKTAVDGIRWSATARRLSLLRLDSRGFLELATIKLNGTGLRVLGPTRSAEQPAVAWSPDGRRLAATYLNSLAETIQIKMFRADGSGSVELPPIDLSHRDQPTWSPDGRFLIYKRFGPGCPRNNGCFFIADATSGAGSPLLPPLVPGCDAGAEELLPCGFADPDWAR